MPHTCFRPLLRLAFAFTLFPAVLQADFEAKPDTSTWFPWKVDSSSGPSVIGMQDWLDKPAGGQGRVTSQGDRLMVGGKPIKLWGINLCYRAGAAPKKAMADKRAAFYAKYGINAVRLHKWAEGIGYAGIQRAESAAEFDPDGLDLFDYQVAKFKEAGIYVTLSQSFGTLAMGPDDVRDVPYAEEFGKFADNAKRNRVGGGNSTFYYSPEIQNLQIRQMANLLAHRNPYTGLTYAEEPAVAFIECINESSLLFFTSMDPLKQSPTLRRITGARFCDWLKARYGSQEGLAKAWGEAAFNCFSQEVPTNDGMPEQLDRQNILPLGNPWFWDPTQLEGSQAKLKQRLLDSLEYLKLLQDEAYDHWLTGLRAAGYKGEVIASNWQAGRAYSHFANLNSDARLGIIDRHNYSKWKGNSMLERAGGGILSTGMQQVKGRPFMISEWLQLMVNDWHPEGIAIIGAYGMGLQGWDASFMFQNGDNGAFRPKLGQDPYEIFTPAMLGTFPAVARQVLRGDVSESEKVAVRNVHVPSLFQGRLAFEDNVKQGYNDKEFDGQEFPAAGLAVAKQVIDFTDTYQESVPIKLDEFRKDGNLIASTGQLRWHEGGSPGESGAFIAIDTPATKGLIGFTKGRSQRVGDVTFAPDNGFCALYVTALGRDESLESAKRILVVAFARTRNTGAEYTLDKDASKNKDHVQGSPAGTAPILLEPVRARVSFAAQPYSHRRVRLLDHDGCSTDQVRELTGGVLEIDGTTDRTPYYLIERE